MTDTELRLIAIVEESGAWPPGRPIPEGGIMYVYWAPNWCEFHLRLCSRDSGLKHSYGPFWTRRVSVCRFNFLCQQLDNIHEMLAALLVDVCALNKPRGKCCVDCQGALQNQPVLPEIA